MIERSSYRKAPDSLMEKRDDILSFMESHMDEPLAVSAEAAFDAVSGDSLGTEAVYGVSFDDAMSGGPFWTLSGFHNFKEHGLIADDDFERSLLAIAGGFEDGAR